jgi:hypothetical protein
VQLRNAQATLSYSQASKKGGYSHKDIGPLGTDAAALLSLWECLTYP